jgi:maltose alpha-D-glucosyltransferase / alpha-amylase
MQDDGCRNGPDFYIRHPTFSIQAAFFSSLLSGHLPMKLTDDPLWYKDAIIYEVHVKSFFDSTNDGIGDFRGLTSKLDYLQDLGITCLWLLPFFPSPLRDDGYDISDYLDVHPSYGTLGDFKTFVSEAHARRIRVLIELVVNHTSDQHPWFQTARRAPRGAREREFYIWSDTDKQFPETRIIFTDTEKSNWSFDPVAGQYYWHRFFSHQPDLNHNNPEVVGAVIDLMTFWFDLGVDAMRLDAVPYLCVREGTINENLPETHAVLRRIRRELDAQYPSCMLLAEANQWPADVREYMGDGDECHMAFHFPLMPRIFMAVRQEDSHPIVDILRQTPEIPPSCQWAIFLRNHDELTLEMVTDEERDYLYDAYAADPLMRLNVGIRRRLAPLMENSRRRVELLNVLLFTLPGTPVIYYGDEIGMGDNIYLGDRNGVRTPMQWSGDRNGGFSRADPARLYAPPIMDPVYGYQAINVEAQERYPVSLLNWMKRIIALRKQHPVLGRGALEFIGSSNRKVLAYVRRDEHETVLVVASLSRQAQPVSLDLSAFEGLTPVEMLGDTEFPRIDEGPYPLSFGTYGYYLFRLEQSVATIAPRAVTPEPAVESVESRPALLAGPEWDTLLQETLRRYIEREALVGFLQAQRWYPGPPGPVPAARFADWTLLQGGRQPIFLTIVETETRDGRRDRHLVPLATVSGAEAERIAKGSPGLVLARITGARKGLLVDAVADDHACGLLLDAIASDRDIAGRHGTIRGVRTEAWLPDEPATLQPVRRGTPERPNSTIAYGVRKHLKLFRRLEPGPHPEIELGMHLTRAGFSRVPPLVGWLEYRPISGDTVALGTLHGRVHNEGETWERTLDELGRYFERVTAAGPPPDAALRDGSLLTLAEGELPEAVKAGIGVPLTAAAVLGRRTAEMHLALGQPTDDPAFAPEPLDASSERVVGRVQQQVAAALADLQALRDRLPDDTRPQADAALRSDVAARLARRRQRRPAGQAIRIHGDYHLGQVLWSEQDVIIVDFEGETSLPLAERRVKAPPLVDVASMVQSFRYAAAIGLMTFCRHHPSPTAPLWAHVWERWMSAVFVHHYLATLGTSPLVPEDRDDRETLFSLLLLAHAATELRDELHNRPEWAHIPLAALLNDRGDGPPA